MCWKQITSLSRVNLIEVQNFRLRDTKEHLRKQLFLSTDHQVVLWPCFKWSPPDYLLHALPCYDVQENCRNHVQRFVNRNGFNNDFTDGDNPLLFDMAQFYTERTVTSLKSNAVLAYHVHAVLLDVKEEFFRFSINHGYTFAAFLSVRTTNDEK